MDPAAFARFCAAVAVDPGAALGRFDALQVAGAAHPRRLMRQLRQLRGGGGGGQLGAGLAWLETLDQRTLLPGLAQPQLHLLAGCDGLVPPALAQSLESLLADAPRAAIALLPGCSHAAPLDAGELLAVLLRQFLEEQGLLHRFPVATGAPAKRDVAESFSRAARDYDSVATLQRDVGTRLLANLDQLAVSPATVLDLGCGTGYFYPELRRRFPAARYIGLDLARGMVEYAREHHPGAGDWLVGDAEALPLAADSVDLVFSSLALQWCFRPAHLFAELARVLRPGGRCVFTSLGPRTLRELRSAWAAVDDRQHVNDFLPPESLVSAARAVPGLRLGLGNECFRMEYRRVRDLLTELKTLGAHNMNRARPSGLTGRRALQGMLEAYESWRENGVLPATYDVLFGVLEKR
jgi:malonyl-CoA O-methyltransferase